MFLSSFLKRNYNKNTILYSSITNYNNKIQRIKQFQSSYNKSNSILDYFKICEEIKYFGLNDFGKKFLIANPKYYNFGYWRYFYNFHENKIEFYDYITKLYLSFLLKISILLLIFSLFDKNKKILSIYNDFKIYLSKKKNEEKKDIMFEDIIGIDNYKEELHEILEFLKNPDKYHKMGALLPKGILLAGPPGSGKTLMAKALANEANCKFIYKTGSEFDNLFVGSGSKKIREVFKEARKDNKPCIIFIDEIDGIAGKRNEKDKSYFRSSLNQLLTEIDGFKKDDNIIILGATNFLESIDKAILRPGRFDKIINISYPDALGREKILNYYLNKTKFCNKIDIKKLSFKTSRFTGCDIKNLINLAALESIKNKKNEIREVDFDNAYDKIKLGVSQNLNCTDIEKLKTAYHEAGHALVNLLTKNTIPLNKVTILPRGSALGYTSMVPDKEEYSYTKDRILAMIDTNMGGRAAEKIKFGDKNITTGCGSDLKNATQITYSLIRNYGMSNQYLINNSKDNLSDKMNEEIDIIANNILNESYQRAELLLENNRGLLDTLSNELILKETLSSEEIRELLKL